MTMRTATTGLTVLAGLLLGWAGTARAVPIVINYTDGVSEGFNDPTPYNLSPYTGQGLTLGQVRRRAIEAAAANWANRLQGTVPIQVNAAMNPMGGTSNSATLGGASPRFTIWNFPNVPQSNIRYAISEANQIAGEDLIPPGNAEGYAPEDITITYNSDVDNATVLGSASFYYGTDGRRVSSGGVYYDIDFYDTCLHELGHGLGFTSGIAQSGSLGTVPMIFATFMVNGPDPSATRLVAMGTDAERASAIISGSLYWAGTNGRRALADATNLDGLNPKLYGPNPYETGSSTSHLDEAQFSGTSGQAHLNELMTPYLGPGITHYPGPVTSGIFQDIGWVFTPYTLAEAAKALRIYGGLLEAQESDVSRLNNERIMEYPGRVTLADALRIVRGATGTDPNPFILGTP